MKSILAAMLAVAATLCVARGAAAMEDTPTSSPLGVPHLSLEGGPVWTRVPPSGPTMEATPRTGATLRLGGELEFATGRPFVTVVGFGGRFLTVGDSPALSAGPRVDVQLARVMRIGFGVEIFGGYHVLDLGLDVHASVDMLHTVGMFSGMHGTTDHAIYAFGSAQMTASGSPFAVVGVGARY